MWLKIDYAFMQPSSNQYGSVDSANATNGQIPSFERSVTPLLPDFMDPSVCYVPNGYPPAAFFYGSKLLRELGILSIGRLNCFCFSPIQTFLYG